MDALTRPECLSPPLAGEVGGPPQLLIVDDCPENLTVLGSILSPHYRVRAANGGAAALAAAALEPRPALILLDVMMPGLDGYEVLARLRAQPETAGIPVIFVTALCDTEDERRGLELGAVDYLTKPVHPGLTLARVRGHLTRIAAQELIHSRKNWLEEEVHRRTLETRRVRDLSVRTLANLAEARDNETGNHILRTQGYVQVLAQELARTPTYRELLSPALVELIVTAAPLHDIGKVAIADEVLHKPGRLDAREWAEMQTHAQLGADALRRAITPDVGPAGLEFLHVAIDIAHYHHEKWDGSGYPAGLAHHDIPLPARLMALADVFDALITERVYKPGYAVDVAVTIIRDGSGTHFDPDVVAAFDATLAQFKDIAARHADRHVAGTTMARARS